MRITSLTLKNWRTFKHLELDIGDRLIVVGPNASGKSSLLDSIQFPRDLALPDGGLQAAIRARGRPNRVQCLYSPDFNEGLVEISVTLGDLGG